METHFHWDIANIAFFGFVTAAWFHLMRMLGAKVGGQLGTALGGFFTFGS